MKLPLYQLDAFTDRVFAGNPAAVCPLQAWLPDATLQAIAADGSYLHWVRDIRRRQPGPGRWQERGAAAR